MDPTVVAAWIAAGVSVLTLLGTLAAQHFGRRATKEDTEKAFTEQRRQLNETLKAQSEQLDRTLAEQRTRTLNERFGAAAEQLGSDKPAVRLAGVYAMAGLADDWEENRQACVDVLCAYLRMPYEPDPGPDALALQQLVFRAAREVRRTVIRVISAHLREHITTSWQGLDLDFTGAVFDGGDFFNVRFSGGIVSFNSARFSGGAVNFSKAQFSGGSVNFSKAQFSGGTVNFGGTEFSGGTVSFWDARFSGGTVIFGGARFSGSTVSFWGAEFSGSTVDLSYTEFSGGRVSFFKAGFSGGKVSFWGTEFSGAEVDFNRAQFASAGVGFSDGRFSGGKVSFHAATFAGAVDFNLARFSGAEVDFSLAEFSGPVDFSEVNDWSFPPAFSWKDIPPEGVKLPGAGIAGPAGSA
jgi:uncharacterized protein YjbI with pentapeptide repeats